MFRYLGQLQETRSGKCLDAVGRETPLAMRDCHGLGGYQTLMYSEAMEIRTATRCLSPDLLKVSFDASTTFLGTLSFPCDKPQILTITDVNMSSKYTVFRPLSRHILFSVRSSGYSCTSRTT